VHTVLAHSDTFGTSPQHLDEDTTAEGRVCCGGSKAAGDETPPASAAACC
jgi:lactoylglutathione lyase